MCSLCGDLSTRAHWSEQAPGAAEPAQARRHRAARTAYAAALLRAHGLTLAEWQGSYMVGNGRGRTEVVPDLAACWVVAERLAGRAVDPLADNAAAALAGAAS
jgi:hypothetical protein